MRLVALLSRGCCAILDIFGFGSCFRLIIKPPGHALDSLRRLSPELMTMANEEDKKDNEEANEEDKKENKKSESKGWLSNLPFTTRLEGYSKDRGKKRREKMKEKRKKEKEKRNEAMENEGR
jgi:hypothetical protein